MKKLKLMALGLMFLMVQSAVAVQLPSTSYAPVSAGESYGSVAISNGVASSKSFFALGEGEDKPFDDCIGSTQPGQIERLNCCETAFSQCITNCGEDLDCQDNCEARSKTCPGAPSLPLDGGLSILLVLALGSGAVRAFRKK